MSLSHSSHDHPEQDTRQDHYHRPHDLDPDLFVAHNDVETAIPTPPYRRIASSSQAIIESYPEQSPAYKSRSNVALTEIDMSDVAHPTGEKHHDYASKGKQSVHYPDTFEQPPPIRRFDTDTRPASRASSLAGTDDEESDNDYDWSGDEDLVDEEAKFEHAMGVNKTNRSGCARCVLSMWSDTAQRPHPKSRDAVG